MAFTRLGSSISQGLQDGVQRGLSESPRAIYKSVRSVGSIYSSPDSVSAYAGENIGATSEKLVQKAVDRGGKKYRGRSPIGVNIFGIEGHNLIRNTARKGINTIKSLPTQFTESVANSPKLLRPVAIKAPLYSPMSHVYQKSRANISPISPLSSRGYLTPSPIQTSNQETEDENKNRTNEYVIQQIMRGGVLTAKAPRRRNFHKTRRGNRKSRKTRRFSSQFRRF